MQPSDQQTKEDATAPTERMVLFGAFALSLETGELRRSGIKIRLQNKPFQILKALVEHPGRVVTREDLRIRLWPKDTFVDFESGLNTAVNRLRLALGDSAEDCRYIETLPRIGYRFIAPVRHPIDVASVPEPANGAVSVPEQPAAHQPAPALPVFRISSLEIPLRAYALALLVFALGAAAALGWSHMGRRVPAAVYHQLTFRRGTVENARFTASGAVVYDARWKDQPRRTYLMEPASPESRELELGNARLTAVSRTSKLAILEPDLAKDYGSNLAVVALLGGAPRVVDSRIEAADWGRDGLTMCVVRAVAHGVSLEYPAGKVIYHSSGLLGQPRLSPNADLIAVVEHPLKEDDAGSLLVIDRGGHVRRLSENWGSMGGVAWNPSGTEVWFAAAKQGVNREIYAVELNGRLRRIASLAAMLDLFDIAPSGRVLIGRSVSRLSMFVGDTRTGAVKDDSWLDWSRVTALSADGNSVLFDESGEGGGPLYTVYLYHRDRNATERIGNGRAMDISADGHWILTGSHSNSSELHLIATADSRQKTISQPGFTYQTARFLPSSREIVVQGNFGEKPVETYLQNLDTGKLCEVTSAAGMDHMTPSPNGKELAGYLSPTQIGIIDLAKNSKSVITSTEPSAPVAWASETELVVSVMKEGSLSLQKWNLADGKRQTLFFLPAAPGVNEPFDLVLSADLKTFAFCRTESSTGLFAVDGWM